MQTEMMPAAPPLAFHDSEDRLPRPIEELGDLVRYRDLVLALVESSLKSRYKRSVLGVLWTLLNPLVTMLVTTIAFARVFRNEVGAYPVYVLSGTLLWTFFSQSTQVAMHRLVYEGGAIMRRVYLPRALFPVVAVGTGLVNLALGLLPLALVALGYGIRPSRAWLFLPVAVALALMFTMGVALALSACAVFFTDVIEIYQAAVMALFYVTPVLYPASIIPREFAWMLALNPLSHLLEIFRAPILDASLPSWSALSVAALWAVASLAGGFWLYTSKADEFVYRT